MKFTVQQRVTDAIAALFILLFLYTAVSKSLQYPAFLNTIKLFPGIESNTELVAISIIALEFVASVLLFIPSFKIYGFYLSLLLMVSFTMYISYALLSGYKLPCTCGGVLQQMTWKQHLLFNLIFILAVVAAIMLSRKAKLLISRRSRKPV